MSLSLGLLKNLLAQADAKALREHSMLNHHAPGLDYLNLHRSPGLTVKVYLSDPKRLQSCGVGDYLVRPHDHGYNFDTYVAAGRVIHSTFAVREAGRWDHRSWAPWKAFSFDWRAKSFTELAPRFELHEERHVHRVGSGYYLDHKVVHTIALRSYEPMCLLLTQYADQPKARTRLFTLDEAPKLDGLYVRPTVAETQRLIDRTRELALGAS